MKESLRFYIALPAAYLIIAFVWLATWIVGDAEDEDKKQADVEAKRIDEIYANRQEAKLRMGVPERIPKGT